MNAKFLVLIGLVSIMTTCGTVPGNLNTYDSDVTEYRLLIVRWQVSKS